MTRCGHMASGHVNRIKKAEHMAAPTNAAKREKSSLQRGAVHTWHRTDMPSPFNDVRCLDQSGKHLLGASISPFDQERTFKLGLLDLGQGHGGLVSYGLMFNRRP